MINRKIKLASGVLVFALGLTAVSVAVVDNKDTKEEQAANGSLTAGAASEISSYNTESNTALTAGVTSTLYDNSGVSVSSTDKDVVAAANTETETEEVEESVDVACGYDNLGIANISEGNLNVREKASAESEIVGKMTKHNACEILSTDGDWYEIKSGKVRGYVKSEFIVTGDEALTIAEDEVQTIATVENTATLRVRSEQSQDSSTLALVGEGEDLDVVVSDKGDDDFSKWVYVDVDDEQGYVSADYVSLSKKLPTAKTITEVKYGAGISDVRVQLVQYALQFVGNRYVWGGTSLTNGIDCSGFTMQVYAHFGIGLPHHAASQPAYGVKVSAAEAQPGDLFFYGSGSSIGHVGIYIGNGQLVHASNKKDGIKISNAFYRTPVCIVRYFN